jgi:SAM-dependent methyltransferase
MAGMTHLESVRAYELQQVAAEMEAGVRVLEIGAGAGYQARALAEKGFDVAAVDLASSDYVDVRVWPVIDYDGRHLPFGEAEFDVVFSSNVLEHIADVESFQAETIRVLRRGGRAIHVLPTPTWRLWTNLSHYLFLVKFVLLLLRPQPQDVDGVASRNVRNWEGRKRESWAQILRRTLRLTLPARHGERGNALSEVYWFSRAYWVPLFRRAGFVVERRRPLHLFYTGHEILGASLPLSVRHALSFVLGSATMLYVLRREDRR